MFPYIFVLIFVSVRRASENSVTRKQIFPLKYSVHISSFKQLNTITISLIIKSNEFCLLQRQAF